ncbi:MAG: phosphatase PAP2 family protein [Acidobacteriota bacterium]
MATSRVIIKPLEQWQIAVCLCVCAYLVLGKITYTLRPYHWFMLLVIPGVILVAEHGRRFFTDWSPMFAFWLIYDRLRWLQPLLLSRVAVELPYKIEQWLFGDICAGSIPAHTLRAWLALHSSEPIARAISLTAQLVYLSHIAVLPILLFGWWLKSRYWDNNHDQFRLHLRAFTILNVMTILSYLLIPVAPPWWVSLHGSAQPSIQLIAQTSTAAAMDGKIVQKLIATAPMWFGAVPSLHGAYPVLLFLLAQRRRGWLTLIVIGVYAAAMWGATVVLNQHYIVDLVIGAVFAFVAYWLTEKIKLLK